MYRILTFVNNRRKCECIFSVAYVDIRGLWKASLEIRNSCGEEAVGTGVLDGNERKPFTI